MNFTSATRRNRQPVEINVTSLVDIIFNLLLFFMLTTSFSQSEGIEVELPSASAAKTSSEQTNFIITINQDGQTTIDGTPVNRDDMSQKLQDALEKTPKTMLLIRADESTRHADVVEIIDLAKKVGLSRVSIGTQTQ